MEYYRNYDIKKTYTFGDTSESTSAAVSLAHAWEGKLNQVHVVAPAISGCSAVSLAIAQSDGYTIYSSPECGSAASVNLYFGASAIHLPANDLTYTTLSLKGTATSGGSVVVMYKLYGIQG